MSGGQLFIATGALDAAGGLEPAGALEPDTLGAAAAVGAELCAVAALGAGALLAALAGPDFVWLERQAGRPTTMETASAAGILMQT